MFENFTTTELMPYFSLHRLETLGGGEGARDAFQRTTFQLWKSLPTFEGRDVFFHMSYYENGWKHIFFLFIEIIVPNFFSRRWWFCYWSWQFTRGLVRCLLDVFSLSMLCPYAFCMSNMVNSSNVKSQKKLTTQNWKVLWCWQLICFGDDSYDSCDSYDLWLLWLIFFPCLGRAWKSLGACLDS